MKYSPPKVSVLSLSALLLAVGFTVAGCGCDEERPSIVFLNNSTVAVSVHVEDSGGGIIHIAELAAGAMSGDFEISPGMTSLALIWGSIPVPYEHDIETAYCFDYEVEFEGDRVKITQIER